MPIYNVIILVQGNRDTAAYFEVLYYDARRTLLGATHRLMKVFSNRSILLTDATGNK